MKNSKKDLILSFFLPRKMYRHHNMRFILSLAIFVGASLIMLFSVNVATPRFMRKLIQTPDYKNSTYTYVEPIEAFPNYSISFVNNELCLDCDEKGVSEGNTYRKTIHNVLKENNRSHYIDLTVVFLEDYDSYKTEENISDDTFKNYFDINGYLNQTKKEDTDYILYIFTKKSFYYAYNLGSGSKASSIYPMYEYDTTTNKINYFLPASTDELVKDAYGNYDVTKWSKKVNQGENAEFDIDGTKVQVEAKPKLQSKLSNIFSKTEYFYTNTDYEVFNATSEQANFATNANVTEVLSQHVELMVLSDSNVQKSLYSIFVCIINLIFPFIWVLLTWLLSKKFVMSKFREYYAICSLTYLITSIIGFILGFFISFEKLIFILLVIELLYYVVATFRINTDPKLLQENNTTNEDTTDDNTSNHPQKPQEPGFKKPDLHFTKVESDDTYHIE